MEERTTKLIVGIIFMCAFIALFGYYNAQLELQNQDDNKNSYSYYNLNTDDNDEPEISNTITKNIISPIVDGSIVIPNKNGKIMVESIETIENIFKNINEKSITELEECKNTIFQLDLSYHYDKLKTVCIDKLNYYIKYLENYDNSYLKKYNSIKWLEDLSDVFDKINIQYEFTSDDHNHISFYYYDD